MYIIHENVCKWYKNDKKKQLTNIDIWAKVISFVRCSCVLYSTVATTTVQDAKSLKWQYCEMLNSKFYCVLFTARQIEFPRIPITSFLSRNWMNKYIHYLYRYQIDWNDWIQYWLYFGRPCVVVVLGIWWLRLKSRWIRYMNLTDK